MLTIRESAIECRLRQKKAEEKGFADAMEGSLSANPKNLSPVYRNSNTYGLKVKTIFASRPVTTIYSMMTAVPLAEAIKRDLFLAPMLS